MQHYVANYFESRNLGGQITRFAELVEQEPEKFAELHNGFNNTHEALQCMRRAILFIFQARLNGEVLEEMSAASDAFEMLTSVLKETLEDESLLKDMQHPQQMRNRFKRAAVIYPPP